MKYNIDAVDKHLETLLAKERSSVQESLNYSILEGSNIIELIHDSIVHCKTQISKIKIQLEKQQDEIICMRLRRQLQCFENNQMIWHLCGHLQNVSVDIKNIQTRLYADEHINRVINDMLTIPSTHLVIISFDDPVGRILKFYRESARFDQMTVLIGHNLGNIENLAMNYLPKSAIDRTTIRMAELLQHRMGASSSGSVSQEATSRVAIPAEMTSENIENTPSK